MNTLFKLLFASLLLECGFAQEELDQKPKVDYAADEQQSLGEYKKAASRYYKKVAERYFKFKKENKVADSKGIEELVKLHTEARHKRFLYIYDVIGSGVARLGSDVNEVKRVFRESISSDKDGLLKISIYPEIELMNEVGLADAIPNGVQFEWHLVVGYVGDHIVKTGVMRYGTKTPPGSAEIDD